MKIIFIFLIIILPSHSANRYDQLLEQKGFFTNLGNMWYSIVNVLPRSERTLTFYDTTFAMKSFTDGIINWLVIPQTGVAELFKVIFQYFSAAIPVMIPTVIIFGLTLLLFIVWGVYQCFVPPFDPKAGYSCCTACRKPGKYGEIKKFSVFARICIVILSAFMLFFVICAFVAAIFVNIDIKGVFGGATKAIDFFIDAINKLDIINDVSVSFLDLTTATVGKIEVLYDKLQSYTSVIDKYYSADNLIVKILRVVDDGTSSRFPGFTNSTPYDGIIVEGGTAVTDTTKTRACMSSSCLHADFAFLCPTDPEELVTKKLDELLQYKDALDSISSDETAAKTAAQGLSDFIDNPVQDVVSPTYLKGLGFSVGTAVRDYYGKGNTNWGVLKPEVERYIAAIENYADFKKNTMVSSDKRFVCGTYPPFDATQGTVSTYTTGTCTLSPLFPNSLFCHIANVWDKQLAPDTQDFINNDASLGTYVDMGPVSVFDVFSKVISQLDDITASMDELFYKTKETLWRGGNFLRGLNDFVNDYKAIYNSYGNVIFYGTCGLLGVYMLIVLVTVFCIFFCTDDSILCCSQLFHTILVLIFGAIAVVFSFLAMASMDVWKDLYKEQDLGKFNPLFDYLVGLTQPAEGEGEDEGAPEFSMSGLLSSPQSSAPYALASLSAAAAAAENASTSFVHPSLPFLASLSGSGDGAAVGEVMKRLLRSDGQQYGLADRVQDLREGLRLRWMRWMKRAANSGARADGMRSRLLGEDFTAPTYDDYLPFKFLNGTKIGQFYLRGGENDRNPINEDFVDKMIDMFNKKLELIDPSKNPDAYFGGGGATGTGLQSVINTGTKQCEDNMTAFNATVQEIIKPDAVTTMIDELMSPILKQFSHTITTFWLFAFLDMILYVPLMFLMMCGRDLWRKRKKRKVRRLKKAADNSVKSDPSLASSSGGGGGSDGGARSKGLSKSGNSGKRSSSKPRSGSKNSGRGNSGRGRGGGRRGRGRGRGGKN